MCLVLTKQNVFRFQVYGYKLVQVDAKSGIQYIVVLNEECDSILSPVVNEHHRKLLIAALMHIFMSGAPVKEGLLFTIKKWLTCDNLMPYAMSILVVFYVT